MKAFLTLTTVKMTLQTDVIDVALETRQLDPGMGEAVGQRTILRRKQDGSWETWGDVADRVALGNSLLSPIENERELEYQLLRKHLRKATMLLSGRSLQHGDASQPHRPMEVFTNCLESLTKILTLENGPTAIGPLVGQTVTVLAGDGEWREAEVSSHGVQRLYELTFGSTNGRSKHKLKVRATRDHRWLLVDGSETNHIETGDVLRTASWTDEEDAEGIRHGLVFGDGSAHKRRKQDGEIVTQGQAVCSMRLCGYKSKYLSYFAGCTITYPVSAEGDPVVYLGRKGYWKSLPFTTDSAYIAGFIKGWWMADGAKHYGAGDFNQAIQISTAREDAVAWLVDYAAYAGFTITGIRRTERRPGDGSFGNGTGKTLFTVNLSRTGMRRLESLEDLGIEEEVFCLEEPVTHSFVLANGLLTGNCSSAATSFLQLLLLLNGSGVGRCYDDDMMLVDWDNSPNIKCVLDEAHKDFDRSAHESLRDARHKYGTGHDIMWYEVTDSREGWAKALEVWENAAFEKIHRDKMLILDFSGVRPKGSPIHGMQGRPASGPVSLMNAFAKAASIKGARMDKWKQALYIDHYFAEVVHVGDVRRAARMATKIWSDKTVLDFITVKRPIEFEGLTGREIQNLRDEYAADGKQLPFGFLWSANNSVAVDEEFWRLLDLKKDDIGYDESEAKHARKVFGLATEASYADQTGEPGFINVHRLTQKDEGWTDLNHGDYVGSTRYQINDDTQILMARLAKRAKRKRYHMIVNPCSEIVLSALGGFCVIGDCVPYHADTIDEAEEAIRATTRALIRINLLDSVYNKEVKRTNRIGVGLTGVHEFAWKFFGLGFRDLVDESKSRDFWLTLARFHRAVRDEAQKYSTLLGVVMPHTLTTIKPSGSVSKLFGLTEGWHLPAMTQYLRWVQFRKDHELVKQYRKLGYPVRELTQTENTTIVGFPTAPAITQLDMGDKMVTAGDATPEEQYRWLLLGEKFWIRGTDINGEPLEGEFGNQISYTLKYTPDKVDFRHFRDMVRKYQSQVRCCAVMPQVNVVAYEYQPEQPVSRKEFEQIVAKIKPLSAKTVTEDVGFEHLACENGSCPVDFKAQK